MSVTAACLFPWIERRLKVKRQDRRDAHQESILRVRQKIEQLRAPENFLGWLHRVTVDVAKQHRTPYLRNSKPEQKRQPKQIGTKTIIVDDKPHVVRVFEPCRPEQPRQPLLEPLSDSIITNWSKGNRPNYPRKIDVWHAMANLPERWATVVLLRYAEECTAAETAEILRCTVPRVYRLAQLAKRRIRELLAGYAQNRGGKVKIKIEVAPGYSVEYIESFYSSDEAHALLHALLAVEMTPEVIRMYGRDTVTKRRSEQYGADYRYNAGAKDSQEWTPLMLSIRERMESVAGPLDGGLVQVYPHGETAIGWHEDKGKPEIIASLSLGAEREFSFGVGPASKCQEVWRMRLGHGSLLLIPAKTNEALKHRLPPARRIREPRVNVTLRRFPQSG